MVKYQECRTKSIMKTPGFNAIKSVSKTSVDYKYSGNFLSDSNNVIPQSKVILYRKGGQWCLGVEGPYSTTSLDVLRAVVED